MLCSIQYRVHRKSFIYDIFKWMCLLLYETSKNMYEKLKKTHNIKWTIEQNRLRRSLILYKI